MEGNLTMDLGDILDPLPSRIFFSRAGHFLADGIMAEDEMMMGW